MKIYIAGPITGLDYEEAFSLFEYAEVHLEAQGHEPVNPMRKVSEQAGHSWADYMREDIPLLLACEGIYMLSSWQASKGARLEHHIAQELGMTVIYADK